MKKLFISDVLKRAEIGKEVTLLGWIVAKREHGSLLFLDLADSTGSIQIIIKKGADLTTFSAAQSLAIESSVRVSGAVLHSLNHDGLEIEAKTIELIGGVSLTIDPKPRTSFDIFDPKFADLTLKNRHLYLRNKKLMAALKVRHTFLGAIHHWFREQDFIEVHGPVLAQVPLYEDKTAFSLDFFGHKVYLTQCVAFYLESAVHAFEKVYNVGPSFRAEESKSRRHLAEYWHLKAELAFADLNDIMSLTEGMIAAVAKQVEIKSTAELEVLGTTINADDLAATPYPRITYPEAFEMLRAEGKTPEWEESLGAGELAALSKHFSTPFWITGLPRLIEPFPYMIDPDDSRLTKTADLIAPAGYGELLGVAEKIHEPEQLLERMKEKGRASDERYKWYYELRCLGSVPHSGLGMGIERVLRWLLKLNHVRDVIPFPRLFDRSPYP